MGVLNWGLYKSTDAGGTFRLTNTRNDATGSFDGALPNDEPASLIIDPTDPSKVFATFRSIGGAKRAFRSIHAGASWAAIDPVNSTAAGLVMDLNDSSVPILHGTAGVFYRSSDGGDTWSLPFSGLNDIVATQMVFDPFDSTHLLIAGIREFRPEPTSVVVTDVLLESRDGGTTWTDIKAQLPTSNGYVIAFSPTTQGTVLVGLDPQKGPYLSLSPTAISFHDVSSGLEAGVANVQTEPLVIAPLGAPVPGALFARSTNGLYATEFPGT